MSYKRYKLDDKALYQPGSNNNGLSNVYGPGSARTPVNAGAGFVRQSKLFDLTSHIEDVILAPSNLITANNGLTKTGSNIELGGTLTKDTTIDSDYNDYNILNLKNLKVESKDPLQPADFSTHLMSDISHQIYFQNFSGGTSFLKLKIIGNGSAGIELFGIPSYTDDVAAGADGLVTGELYQTLGNGETAPFNTAGILMIKQ
jgi:hypothetical protein